MGSQDSHINSKLHPSAAVAFAKRLELYGDMGDAWGDFWLGWSHRTFLVAVVRKPKPYPHCTKP